MLASELLNQGVWNLPPWWHNLFLFLLHNLPSSFPDAEASSKQYLTSTTNGILSIKEAYLFKSHSSTSVDWDRSIWAEDIPHAKYFLVWRLMHNNIPNDDLLQARGFKMASMCISRTTDISIDHVLFGFPYVVHI